MMPHVLDKLLLIYFVGANRQNRVPQWIQAYRRLRSERHFRRCQRKGKTAHAFKFLDVLFALAPRGRHRLSRNTIGVMPFGFSSASHVFRFRIRAAKAVAPLLITPMHTPFDRQ